MQYTYSDLKTRYPFYYRNHPKRPPGRPCCICIYIPTYIYVNIIKTYVHMQYTYSDLKTRYPFHYRI